MSFIERVFWQAGVDDYRAGRGFRKEYDTWTDHQAKCYEQGRADAMKEELRKADCYERGWVAAIKEKLRKAGT